MKKLLLITQIIFVSLMSYSQVDEDKQLTESSKSLAIWLNNLNTKNYDKCWDGLSKKIQIMTDYDEWSKIISEEMDLFGEFNGRKEVFREFSSFEEGFGSGYYAKFLFASKYENTSEHTEYILLHQDNKKNWKILQFEYEFSGANFYD